MRDGCVVFVEPGAEPPRGDSQPATPRGGVPPGPSSAGSSSGGYLPEILTKYPDDFAFPADDPEVYGLYGPVKAGSRQVPDLTTDHWAILSKSKKFLAEVDFNKKNYN